MPRIRPARRVRFGALTLLLAVLPWSGAGQAQPDAGFPFGRELLLDTAPMKGSKRVPSIDIGENGAAEFTLWCNTVKAQLVVAGDTITIITGPSTERQCPPERLRGDEEMLAALTDVTNWRREGGLLILTGARTVRFRLQTN
jgi:heat shock protein HslJ